MRPSVDLTGAVFGKLTVLRRAEGRAQWQCRCACGAETLIWTSNLTSGHTLSCGCRRAEISRAALTKHGHAPWGKPCSGEYGSWQAMIKRCYLPANRAYVLYGARGITVCDRWRNDFAAFLADMGQRPSPAHTVERQDVNGNYEPGNCRWATRKEQNRNRRSNHKLTHQGETLTIAEWSERLSFARSRISWRLRNGWSVEEALSSKRVRVVRGRSA